MCRNIRKLVKECDVCQTSEHETIHPIGLLQPLPIPTSPWLDISMHIIEGRPTSDGFTMIFTIVDRLTKFAHFFPLPNPYTTSKVAQLFFFPRVFNLHGMPKSIPLGMEFVDSSCKMMLQHH